MNIDRSYLLAQICHGVFQIKFIGLALYCKVKSKVDKVNLFPFKISVKDWICYKYNDCLNGSHLFYRSEGLVVMDPHCSFPNKTRRAL